MTASARALVGLVALLALGPACKAPIEGAPCPCLMELGYTCDRSGGEPGVCRIGNGLGDDGGVADASSGPDASWPPGDGGVDGGTWEFPDSGAGDRDGGGEPLPDASFDIDGGESSADAG